MNTIMDILDTKRIAKNVCNDFLSRRNISYEMLTNLVPNLNDFEALILVGSVAEGLSNNSSDIDLVLIGDPKLEKRKFVYSNNDIFEAEEERTGIEIDITQITISQLYALAKRYLECSNFINAGIEGYGPNQAAFDPYFLKRMHRFHWGIPLHGLDYIDTWKKSVSLDNFETYLTTIYLIQFLNLVSDFYGEVKYEIMGSAAHISRISVSNYLLPALLSCVGETCPILKWHGKIVNRQSDRIFNLANEALNYPTKISSSQITEQLILDYSELYLKIISEIFKELPIVQSLILNSRHRNSFALESYRTNL